MITEKNDNQVFFVRCPDYQEEFQPAFVQLLSLSQILHPEEVKGKRVLIKPNLLTNRSPEQAVTTHPLLVRSVIRYLKAAGADVSVGDSPASVANLKQVWKETGVATVCAEEGVPLISFEQAGATSFNINDFSFALANPVLQSDLVVNLPKVKSHSLTILTAAVKNMYGAIPGYTKTGLHKRYPQPSIFGRLIRTIWERLPPTVSIADGVVGMEGQGPSNGTPIQLGFLAAAKNPFALDRALCDVLRIKAKRVPYLQCTPVETQCEKPCIKGDIPDIRGFKVPAGGYLLNLVPSWADHFTSRIIWVRPKISDKNCIRCKMCVQACPVKALALEPGMQAPVLTPQLCISCSCCHEVCPANAIKMQQSNFLRVLKVFKGFN